MICLLVQAFRDSQAVQKFDQWHQIQSYINQNVNRFTQEVIVMKIKVQDPLFIAPVEKISQIYEEFFKDQNASQRLFLQASCSNQAVKTIIYFVQSMTEYLLEKEGILNKNPSEAQEITLQDQIDNKKIPSCNQTNDETPSSIRHSPLELSKRINNDS